MKCPDKLEPQASTELDEAKDDIADIVGSYCSYYGKTKRYDWLIAADRIITAIKAAGYVKLDEPESRLFEYKVIALHLIGMDYESIRRLLKVEYDINTDIHDTAGVINLLNTVKSNCARRIKNRGLTVTGRGYMSRDEVVGDAAIELVAKWLHGFSLMGKGLEPWWGHNDVNKLHDGACGLMWEVATDAEKTKFTGRAKALVQALINKVKSE